MSDWKRFVLLNIAALIGIGASLFMAPGNTPFWLWAVIAVVFLSVWNVLLFRQRGRGSDRAGRSMRTIMAVLGLALLIVDLILSRHFR